MAASAQTLPCLPPTGVARFLGADGHMNMCLVPPNGGVCRCRLRAPSPCDVTVAGGRPGLEKGEGGVPCCPRFPHAPRPRPRTYVYTRRVNQTRRVRVLYTPRVSQQHGPLLCPLFAGQKNNQYSRGRRRQWSARTRTQGTPSSSLPPPPPRSCSVTTSFALPVETLPTILSTIGSSDHRGHVALLCCEATPPL